MMITKKYLRKNIKHIFVFGDNELRIGKGGAAFLRNEPNTYGFITKKQPSTNKEAYYTVKEYQKVFNKELGKLIIEINNNPKQTYLISKLGSGLANKYFIWENIIKKELLTLIEYKNVQLLW